MIIGKDESKNTKKSASPLTETIEKIVQLQKKTEKEAKQGLRTKKIDTFNSFSHQQYFSGDNIMNKQTSSNSYFTQKSSSFIFDDNERIE